MDLKVYYQKLRQDRKRSLTEPHAVVVSLATPDGGRAGVATEAPRDVAAKMIVEGSARAGDRERGAGVPGEVPGGQPRGGTGVAGASRIQVTVLSEPEARKPAGGSKGTKGQ